MDALTLRQRARRKEIEEKQGARLFKKMKTKYFSQQRRWKEYSLEEVVKDLGRCLSIGMDFELLGTVVWYMNTACKELNEATWKSRKGQVKLFEEEQKDD